MPRVQLVAILAALILLTTYLTLPWPPRLKVGLAYWLTAQWFLLVVSKTGTLHTALKELYLLMRSLDQT